MVLGLRGTLLATLIALIALCGCENATNLLVDALSPDDPVMEPMPVEETVPWRTILQNPVWSLYLSNWCG